MQALFYGSAVLFPVARVIDISPTAAHLVLLNPAAQAIQDAREAIIPGLALPGFSTNDLLLVIPLVIVLVVLIFGAWLFKKRSPRFAEEI